MAEMGSCLRLPCSGADYDLQRLLAVAYVDPAERLPAPHAAAFFTSSIRYDRVHRRGRRRTAWALNQLRSADFGFVHCLFPAYVYTL
jgi:hypothetical protein